MNRRSFIKKGSVISLPLLLGGQSIGVLSPTSKLMALRANAENEDRVLVLIQLNGGNDGLNTLIPLDQYDRLVDVRPNIVVEESRILKLNDNLGMHPVMEPILNLMNEGKVGFIQEVGYPSPNLSHFRSTDIVTSASSSDEIVSTGWLGRYLEHDFPAYPEGFPNEQNPDPLAITIGSVISHTCQGTSSTMGVAIRNIDTSFSGNETGSAQVEGTYGAELQFVQQAQFQTQAYLQTINEKGNNADNLSPLFPEPGVNDLADQLGVVSRLIAGGLKTQIYVVCIGGFDNHANQVLPEDTSSGDHAELLAQLSEAVAAFQDDLARHGIEDRVLGMTFTEFGRRVTSNASFGTDHGSTSPIMIFGSQVNSEIQGSNPVIPEGIDNRFLLEPQYDFRAVYGSVLRDWFCVEETLIDDLFFSDFPQVQITAGNIVTSLESEETPELNLYPNPTTEYLFVTPPILCTEAFAEVISPEGQRLFSTALKQSADGSFLEPLNVKSLSAGSYILKVSACGKQFTSRFIRQ